MRPRILLIYPKSNAVSYADLRSIDELTDSPGALLSATLPTLAALTPEGFDVTIVDEHVSPIDFDTPCDIVGLTGFPTQLARASKIGEEFRRRGKLVVSGGPSASLGPDRWRQFSDVLFIGEAERTWPRFLAEWREGRHSDTYHEKEMVDIALSPVPDYRPLGKGTADRFLGGVIQTSRGCPFNCEFCAVIAFSGRKMRYKTPAAVMAEVQQMYDLGKRFIFLADDNFSAGRKEARPILEAIRDWNRKQREPMVFSTQLSIDIARDADFLKLAAEAGLTRVYIGIESPSEESLRETRKLQNVRNDMLAGLRAFHEHGILVMGGSIVGFDHDDLDIFQRHYDFFMTSGIPSVHVYPLQAPDGTPLKERMMGEGRFVDWLETFADNLELANNFNTFTVVPKRLTVRQLQQGTLWLVWQLYKPDAFYTRLKTFFDHYEASPIKDQIQTPRYGLNRESRPIAWRILKYFLFGASKQERRFVRQLVQLARRSSHPQAVGIALTSYLAALNTRKTVQGVAPDVDRISYPAPVPTPAAPHPHVPPPPPAPLPHALH